MSEEARVADIRRNALDAAEGPLEVAGRVRLQRGPRRARPVRPRGKLVGAEVDDGRVVERPVDRVPRARHRPQDRRLPLLGHRRLATAKRETPGLVRGQHLALEHRQQSAVVSDNREELGAPDPGRGERRAHVQAARSAAQEVGRPPQQLDDPGAFVLYGLDRESGARVQAKHGLIQDRELGPAVGLHANRVTGRIGVVQLDRLPLRFAHSPGFHGALHRHRSGHRSRSRLGRRLVRGEQGRREARAHEEMPEAPGASMKDRQEDEASPRQQMPGRTAREARRHRLTPDRHRSRAADTTDVEDPRDPRWITGNVRPTSPPRPPSRSSAAFRPLNVVSRSARGRTMAVPRQRCQ